MKILDRYIGRAVIGGSLLALAILLAMFSFFVLVDHLGDVGKGNYGLWHVFEYVLLTLPRRAYETFPMAALIGSLLGLGMLASNSELTIVRSTGVSMMRIVGSVMKAGAILMVIAIVLGEMIAPWTEMLAQTRRAEAMATETTLTADHGLWARDGTSFINIRRVENDERMSNIYIYEFDEEHRLRAATHAAEALYEDDRWLLSNIRQSSLEPGRVQTAAIDHAEWDSAFGPDLINVAVDEPQRLSAWGLFKYVRYLRSNGLESAPYELGLWSKLVNPLATGVMIFLAIPFVFGTLRSVTVGQRILVGVLVGIGFQIMNQTFVKMGLVYGLSPFFSAVLPTLAFLLVAFLLLQRVH